MAVPRPIGLWLMNRVANGDASAEEIQKAKDYAESKQQDFSEGAAMQVKRDILQSLFPENIDLIQHAIHDVRFRMEAYKFVNVLCFYRVDIKDGQGTCCCDCEGLYGLAKENELKKIKRVEDVSKLSSNEVQKLAYNLCEKNHVLNPYQYHIIQLPPMNMNTYGDIVVVVKDESAFRDRIEEAVRNAGGQVVMGNVSYHDMVDRLDPATMKKHSVSVICLSNNSTAVFNANEILKNRDDVIHYGCLDKYRPYAHQKEWRVCWLPDVHNEEGKVLHCGRMDDILEFIPATEIRKYLVSKYKGYIPGVIQEIDGPHNSVGYRRFMNAVENIDGMATILCEREMLYTHGYNNYVYRGKEIDPNVI